MKFPPWRYPHVFRLWQQWLDEGRDHQLDQWLVNRFKQEKKFGKADRAFYRDAMFGAMRFLSAALSLEQQYANLAEAPDVNTIAAAKLWFWLLLRMDCKAVAPRELSDADNRQAFFSNYQQQIKQLDFNDPKYLLWQGLPIDFHAAFKQRIKANNWDQQTIDTFLSRSNEKALLWLRPQGISAKRCQKFLTAEGIATEISESQQLLFCVGNPKLEHTQTYLDGLVEIQDAASVALTSIVRPQSGQSLWDMCAGAGGKTLALADHYPDTSILATDIRKNALNNLELRAKRANFNNIKIQQHNGQNQLGENLKFDWILIDAPCSGSGVWRRSPDNKHRLVASTELLQLQQSLLNQAKEALTAGGHLLYATCSWLPEENEDQIEKFLQQNPEFQLVKNELHGNPLIDADTMWNALLIKT